MLLFLLGCGPERFPCGEGTEEVDGECVVDYPDPPECAYGVDSFCDMYLGGACPTWEEAITWTCDGHHFDPTGAAGEPVEQSDGDTSCWYPSIYCGGDSGWTELYFSDDEVEWLYMSWPEDAECGGDRFIGEVWC